ncbi:hypothetical protein DQE80_16230, partial [Enterococcus sp. HPCN18]
SGGAGGAAGRAGRGGAGGGDAMKHQFAMRVGPVGFRIGSAWRAPVEQLAALYAGYPGADVPDFTVRLGPPSPLRRWLRPAVALAG